MVIAAFRAAGLHLYNDVALVRQYGTSPMYARNTYNSAAKLHPVHERVLVFRKPAPGVPPSGAVKRLRLSPACRPVPHRRAAPRVPAAE